MTKDQIKAFTLRTTQENHTGLMLVLFDIEKVFLEDAISAYEAEDEIAYREAINKAKKTHNEIMSAMNTEDPKGLRILSILRYIYKLLVTSSVKGKPCGMDEIFKLMDGIRDTFVRLHELDTEGPVMRNTQTVYAGLTYGKGTLNESYGVADYSRRGYKA